MVATLIFTLSFPTLASAMTGYNSNVADFVIDLNRSYVPLSSYKPAVYVIHDGWRINQTGNYYVLGYKNIWGKSSLTSGYISALTVL